MKELSLHILDIAQNSLSAGCTRLDLTAAEHGDELTLVIADDGRGMSREFLASVTDPFTTTRTTRKVGLGLPLLRLAAEHRRHQRAAGVALAAWASICQGESGDGAALQPHYLRLSQAERERLARLQHTDRKDNE